MRTAMLALAALTFIFLGVSFGQQWRAASAGQLSPAARSSLRLSTFLWGLSLLFFLVSLLV